MKLLLSTSRSRPKTRPNLNVNLPYVHCQPAVVGGVGFPFVLSLWLGTSEAEWAPAPAPHHAGSWAPPGSRKEPLLRLVPPPFLRAPSQQPYQLTAHVIDGANSPRQSYPV